MSFAQLPYELRSYIWSLAVEPRCITNMHTVRDVTTNFKKRQRMRGDDILYETSSSRGPALMHVCHESRQHAPYHRSFTRGTQPRWTWVNFDMDIFCVTSVYNVGHINSHRSEIQRLKIQTDDDYSDWYDSATQGGALSCLRELASLREIQIAFDGDLMWENVFTAWEPWGCCPRENITFLDRGSGLVLTGVQLQWLESWHRMFSFRSPGNPPDPDCLAEEIEWAHTELEPWDANFHLSWRQRHEVD